MMKEFDLGDAWTEVMKNYSILEKVGEGSYGQVFKAQCVFTDQIVAIKHVKGFRKHDYDCVKLVREIQIMKRLHQLSAGFEQCCFIPEIYDIIVPPEEKCIEKLNNVFMVMEF